MDERLMRVEEGDVLQYAGATIPDELREDLRRLRAAMDFSDLGESQIAGRNPMLNARTAAQEPVLRAFFSDRSADLRVIARPFFPGRVVLRGFDAIADRGPVVVRAQWPETPRGGQPPRWILVQDEAGRRRFSVIPGSSLPAFERVDPRRPDLIPWAVSRFLHLSARLDLVQLSHPVHETAVAHFLEVAECYDPCA